MWLRRSILRTQIITTFEVTSSISLFSGYRHTNVVFSGKEFKEIYGDDTFKVMRSDMIHNNFKYKFGENIDHIPFNPTRSCNKGGLYFTNKLNITDYTNYGEMIVKVIVPDDAHVYVEDDKAKASKLIIDKEVSLDEIY